MNNNKSNSIVLNNSQSNKSILALDSNKRSSKELNSNRKGVYSTLRKRVKIDNDSLMPDR